MESTVFGEVFSDHMFSMVYENGRWGSPEIVPYGPVPLPPASIALKYAQAVFRGHEGLPRRGRDSPPVPALPERRAPARLVRAALHPADRRAGLRRRPQGADRRRRGLGAGAARLCALYPPGCVFGRRPYRGPASRRYRFIVVTAPVGRYFTGGGGLSLKVEEHYTRSPAEGGLGASKAAANYAGTILSSEGARREGFDQVLWLDGRERRYVEEAGLMNVFFRIGGRAVTPPIGDSILPGVTRDSLITLLRDRGVPVEERRIAIDEVLAAARAGTLEEMFACGTAAVVAPIGNLTWRGEAIAPREAAPGPLTGALYEELTGIQFGRIADPHGWTEIVETG